MEGCAFGRDEASFLMGDRLLQHGGNLDLFPAGAPSGAHNPVLPVRTPYSSTLRGEVPTAHAACGLERRPLRGPRTPEITGNVSRGVSDSNWEMFWKMDNPQYEKMMTMACAKRD